MVKKYSWVLSVIFFLPFGLFFTFSALSSAFGWLEPDEHWLDRINGTILFSILSIFFWYLSIGYIRERLAKRRSKRHGILDEINALRVREGRQPDIRLIITVFISIAVYFFAPFFFARDNVYEYSYELLEIMWLGIFPALVIVRWHYFRKVAYQNHRYKIFAIWVFLMGLVLLFSLRYVA